MLTLAPGHANWADYKGKSLNDLVEHFGDQIGHPHFSDNLGRSDDSLTLEVFVEDRNAIVQTRYLIKKMLNNEITPFLSGYLQIG